MCASVIGTLVSGVLLSGYLDYLGLSQKLNGIISAIPIIATLFQPLGALAGQRSGKYKRFVITFAVLQRLLFSCLYSLPLFLDVDVRIAVVVLIFGCAHSFQAFMVPISTDWAMQITPEEERKHFFSRREIALVVTGALMTLVMGFTIQYFTTMGSPEKGYLILSGAVALFACINILCLISIKAPPLMENTPEKMGASLMSPIKDGLFRRVIFGVCLYQFGIHSAIPFWNIHMLDGLKLSYGFITVLSVVISLAKVTTLKLWTRRRSTYSWSQICVFSMLFIGVSHLLNAFARDTIAVWFLPIVQMVGMVGWAFIGMGLLNFQYDNISPSNKATYIGVQAVISGVVGFAGTLFGGVIMDLADSMKMIIGSRIIAGQQIQMLVSFMIITAAGLYIHFQFKRGHIR